MKTSPAAFLRQVKQEIAKITWPSRREATQATIVVMAMCLILAVYFFVADRVSAGIIKTILGIGA